MANPTYQSGFYAPGRGTAKYPELWRGCVGAWNPGLGNTGLVLRDWSGNQNNGVLTGGPTWGVSGGRQALSFDGSNDYVDCGDVLNQTTNDFTLSVWIKTTQTSRGYILSKQEFSAAAGYHLEINGTGVGKARVGISDGTNAAFDSTSTGYNDGGWHHVLVVFDRSGVATFYKDGIADGSSSIVTASGDTSNTQPFVIGANSDHVNALYTGQLSGIRVYNRALSLNEIRLLAQRPGIAYERAPRKFYSLPAAAGNPTGILINNLQSIRLGL